MASSSSSVSEISREVLDRYSTLHLRLRQAYSLFGLSWRPNWFVKALTRFLLTVTRDTRVPEEQFDWSDQAAVCKFQEELAFHGINQDTFEQSFQSLQRYCTDNLTIWRGRTQKVPTENALSCEDVPPRNVAALSLLWSSNKTSQRLHHLKSLLFVKNGFTFEAFADVFNRVLFDRARELHPDLPRGFCSLTSQLDGSMGSFFDVDLTCSGEQGWVVNPPFVESLMDRVADKVLEVADRVPLIIIFPQWHDASGHRKLAESAFFHPCEPGMHFTNEDGDLYEKIRITVFQNKSFLSAKELSGGE